jgi:hypothetical protein
VIVLTLSIKVNDVKEHTISRAQLKRATIGYPQAEIHAITPKGARIEPETKPQRRMQHIVRVARKGGK